MDVRPAALFGLLGIGLFGALLRELDVRLIVGLRLVGFRIFGVLRLLGILGLLRVFRLRILGLLGGTLLGGLFALRGAELDHGTVHLCDQLLEHRPILVAGGVEVGRLDVLADHLIGSVRQRSDLLGARAFGDGRRVFTLRAEGFILVVQRLEAGEL